MIEYLKRYDQIWPPAPTFTETSLPASLADKVYLITGSNSGVGLSLATILYSKHAKVWIAARSETKAQAAIELIRETHPSSTGSLHYLKLELDDLPAVARAARELLAREIRLDVLFNNAGVMHVPQGSVTKQGYELHLGTNNLGHWLFTDMVTPLLVRTAANTNQAGSVRVVWLSSLYSYSAPRGGMVFDDLEYKKRNAGKYEKYSVSKAGAWYEASVYARRHKEDGIVSVAVNPGNLRTDLLRHYPAWQRWLANTLLLNPIIKGAYSELFAGLSPEITLEKTGAWIIPWGRFGKVRPDLERGALPASDDLPGSGLADRWVEWEEQQVSSYKLPPQ
ncbi:hypothetical protein B0T17DRAFT_616661 [Bombardia bombarda]|uniref:NAD(P)-binding protein n=1 Tax=Bombardia bombarda TaxID=252184 RepID=A0AA39XBX7_9PEZI|nr:hypothetical protein B0T17DRAFT_616661 [Bombardia bombarda]